ncbi:unnamed protein product [marine sediment metagenome]|uniref:Uncharacterized protein n=1 Tax=marine sediment metagenome TaxID=412755 RepID=X1ADN0_9ZZZZ
MIKKMLNYIMSNTRRAYVLLSITFMIGFLLMVITISTHELDKIEFSELYEIVIFIIFSFGMFISFISIGIMSGIYTTNLQHNQMIKEMKG